MSTPPPSPPPAPPPSGVDLPTLIVTAIASALAAYICSKVWKPGTLASAAMTPVLVALGKEALRKPTEVVVTVVPPLPRRRVSGPDETTDVHDPVDSDADGPPVATPAVVSVKPPVVQTRTTARREIHWRIAVITGVLGFALCAAVITVPELLSRGSGTTLFGGSGSHKVVQHTVTTTTSTVVVPGETVTTTAPTTTTTTPAETATVPATVTTTTTETAPPTVTRTVTTPSTTPPETTSTDSTATEPTSPLP